MLDIYEMSVFLAAAETGSFSEAGRQLGLSQPAISMQIRSLEKHLGVDLFHRAGRHIQLTEIGAALVPLARGLVNHAAQVHETVASMQGEVIGVLKIACSTSIGKYILPRLLARFIEQHPAAHIECQAVDHDAALALVTSGEVHLALSSGRDPSKELDYQPLTADPVVLIVPPNHEWAVCSSISVDDLPSTTFIRRESSSGTLQAVAESLAAHNMSVNNLPATVVLGNAEAVCIAAAEGIGAAFISRRVAADALAAGRVVEVPVRGLEMCQQVYLVQAAQRTPTSVQAAFWEFVQSPAAREVLRG